MSRRALRQTLLRIARALGGFRLAQWITRRDLRILCYHGFSIRDEHEFRPGLFITADEFEGRLTHLERAGYHVLPLGEALDRRRAGTLPACAVCITIDDGFYSTLSVAAPAMHRHRMPSTLYLTTYYVDHQAPIFNLAAAYAFWRTTRETIDLRGLGIRGLPTEVLPWATMAEAQRTDVVERIVSDAVTRLDGGERSALLAQLAERTGTSLEEIVGQRLFHLVTRDEAREIQRFGVDLQLHTHRHRSPGVAAEADRELIDNGAIVRVIAAREPTHFCYPSGRFDRWQDEWLRRHGVQSGTTCVPGFVRAETPQYQLGRFLDGADIDQLTFEAEMSGVLELARRLRTRLRGVARPTFRDDPAEGRALQPRSEP